MRGPSSLAKGSVGHVLFDTPRGGGCRSGLGFGAPLFLRPEEAFSWFTARRTNEANKRGDQTNTRRFASTPANAREAGHELLLFVRQGTTAMAGVGAFQAVCGKIRHVF